MTPGIIRLLFGREGGPLEARRTCDAPPDAVLGAIGRVVPNSPYDLIHWDSAGGHPLAGGTLLLKVRPWLGAPGMGDAFFFRWRLQAVFVRELRLALRPAGGADRSEMVVTGDLDREYRVAARLLLPLGVAGAVVAAVGGHLAAPALGADGVTRTALVWGSAVAGSIAGVGYLGVAGRGAVAKARQQLERMLDAVIAAAR